MLEEQGYRGVVFVDEGGPAEISVSRKARWASHWRWRADCLLLWLPASASVGTLDLVGLGEWADSGRIVLGVADGALVAADELLPWAAARRIPVARTLAGSVRHALALLPPGARRQGAERDVPLHVWNTDWFQGWYEAQRGAGNELVAVKRLWTFRVGPGRRKVVFWALNPRMWVEAERRYLTGEVVIGRPDVSALLMYRLALPRKYTEVVLVRDYRPAARTEDGYVLELPSGACDASDPRIAAEDEFYEETGLGVDPGRLQYHGAQQVWATGAAHVVHLFSVEATPAEIDYMRSQAGVAHGVHQEQEYTYPAVLTVDEVRRSNCIDWSVRGMIAQVLGGR